MSWRNSVDLVEVKAVKVLNIVDFSDTVLTHYDIVEFEVDTRAMYTIHWYWISTIEVDSLNQLNTIDVP